ncbi:acyltransferase family protein [Undibacterium crateris]|uniref:acyltransferase family protein n=1 Tax=Undibacterium crateris TaxID=2528175 RepID=UPI0013895F44|nr:acyltransferase [Undibacterium crateris]NDI84631.1 acyltransferase family protein [Undibacterium crateris]
MKNRILGFDLLRGWCAILVAAYHLMIWQVDVELYSWGLHGVYIFFVLSGASLTLSYKAKFDNNFSIVEFILLRFIRLAPLLILIELLMFLRGLFVDGFSFNLIEKSLLTASMLFGLGNPGGTSLILGGWSLGIEFVFYLLFPLMIALAFSVHWRVITIFFVLAQISFVELTLHGVVNFKEIWVPYTQPLAFIAYFFLGILVGKFILLEKDKNQPWSFLIGVFFFIVLLFSSGISAVQTLTGIRGICLLALVVCIVFFFSRFNPVSPLLKRICIFFGDISYGTYLLHPIVYLIVTKSQYVKKTELVFFIVLTLTIFFALLVERFFELPVQKILKKYQSNFIKVNQ